MSCRLACIVAFAVAAIAHGEDGPSGALAPPGYKDDSCELENGFKNEECGTVNKVKVCCTPEQQCVSAKPWEGDELFACSADRQLSGGKLVVIVLLPVTLAIMFLGVAGFMAAKFPKDLNVGLCIKQVILSVFLLFSPAWPLALYNVILNFFVASAVTLKGLVWWALRLSFILQVFHIIAVFGPFPTFHVPFGGLSTYQDGRGIMHLGDEGATLPLTSEAACTASYGNYFTLLPIELIRKDVDPSQVTFGYCLEEWLTFVRFLTLVVGVLQSVIAFRTGQFLLNITPATDKKSDDIKSDKRDEEAMNVDAY